MEGKSKLIWIKVIHTIIWIFFNIVFGVMFYLGYLGIFNWLFYLCLFFLFLEILILLVNNWECPLTTIAKKYSNSKKSNFDIFLPEIIARYNKEIYILIIFLGFLLIFIKYL